MHHIQPPKEDEYQEELQGRQNIVPPLPVSRKVKPIQWRKFCIWLVSLLFGGLSVLGLFAYYMYSLPPPLPYSKDLKPIPFTAMFPAERCLFLDEERIINKTKEDLYVLETLHYYMHVEEYEAISAFHVGSPICLMLMRLEDGRILELYNVEFRGFGPSSIIYRKEQSVSCPLEELTVPRSDAVHVLYRDSKTAKVQARMFTRQQAWAIQSVGLYLQGRSICSQHRINGLKYDATALPEFIEGSLKLRGCKMQYE